MMRDIAKRVKRGADTYRVFEVCGHEQLQAVGGSAKSALQAWCKLCSPGERPRRSFASKGRKPVGNCTARVFTAHRSKCGALAYGIKEGEPRCAKHLYTGKVRGLERDSV